MDISTIAKQLNIPLSEVKRESAKIFLERKLLEAKTELLVLANKYGVKSIKELDNLIKKGRIHETLESREDFFKFDYLESRINILQKLIESLR